MNSKSKLRLFLIIMLIPLLNAEITYSQDYESWKQAIENQNPSLVIDEIKRYADKGDSEALYYMGILASSGKGANRDFVLSAIFFKGAAEQGHSGAQAELGYMYENGLGVFRDEKQAFELYTLSAKSGNAKGQYKLGQCYYNGRCVSKDLNQAIKYYELSIKNGNIDALSALANIYEDSKSEYKNLIFAYALYDLISKINNNWSNSVERNKKLLASNLSYEDVEKAKEMAAVCLNSKYKQCLNFDDNVVNLASDRKTNNNSNNLKQDTGEISYIDGFKKTCAKLGFKEKTERFGECVLKLMEGAQK